MGEIKWCPNCEKNIRTVKPYDWLILIIPPLWLIYTLWYIGCKRPHCPLCKEEDLHPWKTEIKEIWIKQKGVPCLEDSSESGERNNGSIAKIS